MNEGVDPLQPHCGYRSFVRSFVGYLSTIVRFMSQVFMFTSNFNGNIYLSILLFGIMNMNMLLIIYLTNLYSLFQITILIINISIEIRCKHKHLGHKTNDSPFVFKT